MADPIIGLVITLVILKITWDAWWNDREAVANEPMNRRIRDALGRSPSPAPEPEPEAPERPFDYGAGVRATIPRSGRGVFDAWLREQSHKLATRSETVIVPRMTTR